MWVRMLVGITPYIPPLVQIEINGVAILFGLEISGIVILDSFLIICINTFCIDYVN